MLALIFQIRHERVALDVRRISEVVPRVSLERSADSPAWLSGTFVYRQSVVPVVDLHRLLGAGDCPSQLSSRIIVVPWQHRHQPPCWVGLLAGHVSEIRELPAPAHSASDPSLPADPELGPAILDGNEIVRLLDLDRLLPEAVRERLAGVCCA